MKRAAVALHSLAASTADKVGIEGAFLLIGTALLSVGAGLLNPAGPWLVAGVVALLIAFALAVPRKD